MKRLMISGMVLLVATVAWGQMSGGGMNSLAVAPDGTLLVFWPGPAQVMPMIGNPGMQLVAMSPAGSILWRRTEVAPQAFAFAGNLVVTASREGMGPGTRNPGMNNPARETLTALTLANGTTAWQLQIEGSVTGIATAGTQLYLTVSVGSGAHRLVGPSAGGSIKLTVLAVDAATGTILWRTSLQ